MKKTPSRKTKLLSSREPQFDTLGIVVDLNDAEGRKLAEEIVHQTGDEELRNLIRIANALNKRYIVAAGCFNGKGIVSALCDDKLTLVNAFQMANARMNEIGSRTTEWRLAPDTLATLLKKAVAQPTKKKRWQR